MCASCSRKLTVIQDNPGVAWMSTVTPMDSRMDIRSKIAQFQEDVDVVAEAGVYDKLALKDIPLEHSFVNGMYTRKVVLPPGTIIIGAIHRDDHIGIMSKGRMRYVTEFDGVQELSGACVIKAKAGTKRVAYIIEEVTWTTVHRTDAATVEEAEKELIAESYSAMGLKDPVYVRRELEG